MEILEAQFCSIEKVSKAFRFKGLSSCVINHTGGLLVDETFRKIEYFCTHMQNNEEFYLHKAVHCYK